MDLRHAAQAVGVLDLAAFGVRNHDLAVGQQPAQVGGAGGLAGVRPHGLDARIEGTCELFVASTVMAPATSAIASRWRPRTRASASMAVLICVPLMSDSPSLAWRRYGLRWTRRRAARPLIGRWPRRPTRAASGVGDAAAADEGVALAHDDQGEVGQRGEVAAGADAALLREWPGTTPRLYISISASISSTVTPEWPLASAWMRRARASRLTPRPSSGPMPTA